jgi:hypothetical protein
MLACVSDEMYWFGVARYDVVLFSFVVFCKKFRHGLGTSSFRLGWLRIRYDYKVALMFKCALRMEGFLTCTTGLKSCSVVDAEDAKQDGECMDNVSMYAVILSKP